MKFQSVLHLNKNGTTQVLSLWLGFLGAFFIGLNNVHADNSQSSLSNYSVSIYKIDTTHNPAYKNPLPAFSMQQKHANVLNTDLFYNYRISSYISDSIKHGIAPQTAVQNGVLSLTDNSQSWQGVDAQVTLGYDIIKKGTQDYFGVGLSLGMSLPYDNKDALSNAKASIPGSNANSLDLLSGGTEISGQLLGPKLIFGKSFGDLTSVYGEVSYARQNMQVTNNALDVSSNINGDYFSYEVGMRYQPFADKKDFGLITLEPSLYFTLGVNYSELKMDKFEVDLQEGNGQLEPIKLDASSTQLNFGVDYLF